jgi:hypothetical protein
MLVEDRATDKYRRLYRQLKDEISSSWKVTWRELSQYIDPYTGRYLNTDTVDKDNNGERKDQKILNGVTFEAKRTLAAGLHGGLTSPSRPWFTLGVDDDALMELPEVKEWFHAVRSRMLLVLSKSNFYSSVHQLYEELGQYGTGVMLIEEDFNNSIRFRTYTCGEYMLAGGSEYQTPSILFRRFSLTARQVVDIFGLDKVTVRTKSLYENGKAESRVMVIHAILPVNEGRYKYESVYYELDGGDEDKILRKSGYDGKPFVAPRWDVNGTDVYGTGPGWQSLGDIKQLQSMEQKKLKALDKMIDPPMNAPTSMKGERVTLIPGTVNYVDSVSGGQGLSPTFLVNPNLQAIRVEVEAIEERIKRLFYYDLFLSLSSATKRMTATEVQQRYEEKLMILGPVTERLEHELLNPVIDRVFEIMLRQKLIPPPPEAIAGMTMKIGYISLLAQAQKMVGSGAIEQLAGFVGNLAAVNPSILDKVDMDEAIDQYGMMLGVPPKVVRSDEDVDKIRADKAAQMQQQQNIANATQMAQGAKVLADTKTGEGSALDMILGAQ